MKRHIIASILFYFFTPFSYLYVLCDNPPSLSEIKNLRNSELDEIFKSTVTRPPQGFEEPPPSMNSRGDMNQGGQSMGRYNRPSGPREVPIDHGPVLGPPQTGQTNTEFSQLAQQGANVFANGATAFYRGAASVGQAFGIPAGNYQMPLFSQAAGLFG